MGGGAAPLTMASAPSEEVADKGGRDRVAMEEEAPAPAPTTANGAKQPRLSFKMKTDRVGPPPPSAAKASPRLSSKGSSGRDVASGSAKAAAPHKNHPSERLDGFLALFRKTIDVQQEITGLRLCLLDGLDRACHEYQTQGLTRTFRPPVHNLIDLLHGGAMSVPEQVGRLRASRAPHSHAIPTSPLGRFACPHPTSPRAASVLVLRPFPPCGRLRPAAVRVLTR